MREAEVQEEKGKARQAIDELVEILGQQFDFDALLASNDSTGFKVKLETNKGKLARSVNTLQDTMSQVRSALASKVSKLSQ